MLNISNLSLKPDRLVRIFKLLADENNWANLEELVICDTPLDSLDQELLVDGVLNLMLRKANIARFSVILLNLEILVYHDTVLCASDIWLQSSIPSGAV